MGFDRKPSSFSWNANKMAAALLAGLGSISRRSPSLSDCRTTEPGPQHRHRDRTAEVLARPFQTTSSPKLTPARLGNIGPQVHAVNMRVRFGGGSRSSQPHRSAAPATRPVPSTRWPKLASKWPTSCSSPVRSRHPAKPGFAASKIGPLGAATSSCRTPDGMSHCSRLL